MDFITCLQEYVDTHPAEIRRPMPNHLTVPYLAPVMRTLVLADIMLKKWQHDGYYEVPPELFTYKLRDLNLIESKLWDSMEKLLVELDNGDDYGTRRVWHISPPPDDAAGMANTRAYTDIEIRDLNRAGVVVYQQLPRRIIVLDSFGSELARDSPKYSKHASHIACELQRRIVAGLAHTVCADDLLRQYAKIGLAVNYALNDMFNCVFIYANTSVLGGTYPGSFDGFTRIHDMEIDEPLTAFKLAVLQLPTPALLLHPEILLGFVPA